MSVHVLAPWRLPGCGDTCRPRGHDPHAHEAHGLLLALWTPPTRIVSTGRLTLDLDAQRVLVDGADVNVTATEWRMLHALAREVGRVVAYDDLIASVWGRETLDLPLQSRRSLWCTNLNRLRPRLGDAGTLITTVTAVGLRLERVGPDFVPPPRPPRRPRTTAWAYAWTQCQGCGVSERPHKARGYCARCYGRRWKRRRA